MIPLLTLPTLKPSSQLQHSTQGLMSVFTHTFQGSQSRHSWLMGTCCFLLFLLAAVFMGKGHLSSEVSLLPANQSGVSDSIGLPHL